MPSAIRKRKQQRHTTHIQGSNVQTHIKNMTSFAIKKSVVVSKKPNRKTNTQRKQQQKQTTKTKTKKHQKKTPFINRAKKTNQKTIQQKHKKNSIRHKMYFNRCVNGFIKNLKKGRSTITIFQQKKDIYKTVEKAFKLKDKLFLFVLNKMKSLQTMIEEFNNNLKAEKKLTVTNFNNIFGGNWKHTRSSERYFHDEMYKPLENTILAATEYGPVYEIKDGMPVTNNEIHCLVENMDIRTNNTSDLDHEQETTWLCSAKCNIIPLSLSKLKHFIHQFTQKKTIKSKMTILLNSDNCSIRHITGKMGHSLACSHGDDCNTILHHIRRLAAHHTNIRALLRKIYLVRRPTTHLQLLNSALQSGNLQNLKTLIEQIAENEHIDLQQQNVNPQVHGVQNEKISETYLQNKYFKQIVLFDKAIHEQHDQVCLSCRRTGYKTQVRYVLMDEKIDVHKNNTWQQLYCYLIMENRFDVMKKEIICKYCYSYFNKNSIPPRSVINNMDLENIPDELKNLNAFEKILLEKVHPFQVIVRLKTRVGRIPVKELAQGLHGKVVYLPLNLEENAQTLGLQKKMENILLVLLNGVPTKDKVIWQQVINLTKVKSALQYLIANNKYYQDTNLQDNLPLVDHVSKSMAKEGQIEKISSEQQTHLFEHYTVHPLHSVNIPGDSIDIYQMKKTKSPPISLWEKKLEMQAFPTLFPTGIGGRFDERKVLISASEYRTTRLFLEDPRFRHNIQYIFHLLHDTEFGAICQAVAHTLRTGTRFANMTAAQILAKLQQKDEVLEGNISNIMGIVRSTQEYWFRRYSEVRCMIRNYGPPTFFLTLSCAEYKWTELTNYIRLANSHIPGIDNMTPGELCALDPVLVCRHFDHRFKAMLKLLCNKSNPPLGDVTHFFWRKEYQMRGAPHIHMLLWIKNAPQFGKDSDTTLQHFIQKYITCDIPSTETNEELKKFVLECQKHTCGTYCRRKYKSKGAIYTKCRFGFPRPVRTVGEITNVFSAIRNKVTKRGPKSTYNLPRTQESKNINDYNPLILQLWQANMDIQFVADNTTAIARYVTGYVTKGEKGQVQDIWNDIYENESLSKALISFCTKRFTHRNCGVNEAIDKITGSNLYGSSVNILWMNLGPATKRKRVLKSYSDIQQLADTVPVSNNILKTNMIDTYYSKRPEEMEDICLHDIVTNYTFHVVPPNAEKKIVELIDGSGCLVPHTKPYLINHMEFSTNTIEKKEMFYFCMLQLFQPWRSETDLLQDYASYEKAFEAKRHTITSPTMETFIEQIEISKQQEERLQMELQKQTPQSLQKSLTPNIDIMGRPEIQTDVNIAMEEVESAMNTTATTTTDLQGMIASFNSKQKEIYDTLTKKLTHALLHASNTCTCAETTQILMYISGSAGTGKSFLIRALQCFLQNYTKCITSCIITAPTGLAAFNVNGVTLHRLLMLPIEQEGKLQYTKLATDTCKEIARLLRQMTLLIIDEVSMLSNLMLVFIHMRMQEILGNQQEDLFANKSILVFGDLLQLTPVKGDPILKKLTISDANKYIGSVGTVNLWNYFTYTELTENMRQGSDLIYATMLNKIRFGELDNETKIALHSRLISNLYPNMSTGEELMHHLQVNDKPTICLMPTLRQCDIFNKNMLHLQNQDIVNIPCIDYIDGMDIPLELQRKVIKKLQNEQIAIANTAGLESCLQMCVNSRVMLRRNLDVENGLVNGAMGNIVSFKMDKDNSKIQYLEVKFDNCSKPTLIARLTARFKLFKDVYIKRSQFPMTTAYAITIHKSQGLSLDSAIMDLGSSVFKDAISYVALSRVRTLQGLYLIQISEEKITADVSCMQEYNRLRMQLDDNLPLYTIANFTDLASRKSTNAGKPKDTKLQTNKRKHTDAEEQPSTSYMTVKKTKTDSSKQQPLLQQQIPGLVNKTGVDCYCNSVVIFISAMTGLIEQINTRTNYTLCEQLSLLYQKANTDKQLVNNATPIRHLVAVKQNLLHFLGTTQEDAHEFLLAMLDALSTENIDVDANLKISYNWNHHCPVCNVSENETIPTERFIYIRLPETGKIDFKLLFENSNQGHVCKNCNQDCLSTLTDVTYNKHVMILLGRYCYRTGVKISTKIDNFKYGQISIGHRTYTTRAIIFHEGENIRAGHYTTWIRHQVKWLQYNDACVTTHDRLPKQLMNSYIILLNPKF